jgi:hypothetical protein
MKRQYFCISIQQNISNPMSFALAHENRTDNSRDSKTSSLTNHSSTSHRLNNIKARNSQDNTLYLKRTIDRQAEHRLIHSNSLEFDFAKIGILQPKLKVSQPGDAYEQEADRIAEQVMKMSSSTHIISTALGDKERIDRKCEACEMKKEDEEDEKLNIGRKQSNTSNFEMNDELANEIHNVRSSVASPLDPSTREFMESHFGYDFSNVRIHTDDKAAESARAVNALAYTVANDIVFGAGQYAPKSVEGGQLLAHELTHVIQQNTGNATATRMPNRDVTADLHLQRFVGEFIDTLKAIFDEAIIASKIGDGAIFNGSELLIVQGGAINHRFRAVSGVGGSNEWEKGIGPIPDGNFTIRPHIANRKITKMESGTGGANPISSGHQEIDVTDKKHCPDPAWASFRFCVIDCSAEFGTGAKCYNTTTVWGRHRIKIEPGAVSVRTPTGTTVTRSGFYIHGGDHSVTVTSGCIKVFDDTAFTELLKFKKQIPLVVKKR